MPRYMVGPSHTTYLYGAKTQMMMMKLPCGRGKAFSGGLLWLLQLLVPAKRLLWRFSSHSDHSSLLLAADLITDYDPS
jgi:hypothetical protein